MFPIEGQLPFLQKRDYFNTLSPQGQRPLLQNNCPSFLAFPSPETLKQCNMQFPTFFDKNAQPSLILKPFFVLENTLDTGRKASHSVREIGSGFSRLDWIGRWRGGRHNETGEVASGVCKFVVSQQMLVGQVLIRQYTLISQAACLRNGSPARLHAWNPSHEWQKQFGQKPAEEKVGHQNGGMIP